MLTIENSNLIPKRFKGIYLFYNSDKELLYIGKTSRIQSRFLQHSNTANTFEDDWRNKISYAEVFELKSSCDREIYETYLINKLRPKHNVDKVYKDLTSIELPELKKTFTVLFSYSDICLLRSSFENSILQLKDLYPSHNQVLSKEQEKFIEGVFYKYPYLKVVIDRLGYDYIESQNYKTDKVKRKSRQLIPLSVDELIMEELRDNFFIQFRGTMSNNELVCLLDDIYKSLDICLKAKANHIEKYYHAKKTTY
jgi:hypothetical protein